YRRQRADIPLRGALPMKKHLYFMKITRCIETGGVPRTFILNIDNCLINKLIYNLAGLIKLP
ncbi:hypothetical protein, partial [Bacteroides faecichinchillae]|uniref:hypothetical protein n=1 Tax=Bacteroides faecichinchillae TaxID=871325 RepID=UPI001A7E8A86